jgi:hypothetical protein
MRRFKFRPYLEQDSVFQQEQGHMFSVGGRDYFICKFKTGRNWCTVFDNYRYDSQNGKHVVRMSFVKHPGGVFLFENISRDDRPMGDAKFTCEEVVEYFKRALLIGDFLTKNGLPSKAKSWKANQYAMYRMQQSSINA